MEICALSGWGQPADSLALIMPKKADVTYISYVQHGSSAAFFDALRPQKLKPDILVGWSLGGQLAARLVAEGIIKPRLLVLLAAPYQYLADDKHPEGMNPMLFWTFCQSFRAFPAQTMQRFMLLIAHGDKHMKQLAEQLNIDSDNMLRWADWLDELRDFSGDVLSFKNFPRTLIVQGQQDEVVPAPQAQTWHRKIKNSRIEPIDFCGHAPHLHSPADIRSWMEEELAACKK